MDILLRLRDQAERPVIGLKWFGIERDLSRALGRKVCLVNASVLSPSVRGLVEAQMVASGEKKGGAGGGECMVVPAPPVKGWEFGVPPTVLAVGQGCRIR